MKTTTKRVKVLCNAPCRWLKQSSGESYCTKEEIKVKMHRGCGDYYPINAYEFIASRKHTLFEYAGIKEEDNN